MEKTIQLQVSGLKKKFGGETVLNGIDLDVQKGEVVVVLGPSGCGKSTLLRCMNSLEAPTEGSIRLDGETPATAEDRHGLSKLRAVPPQEHSGQHHRSACPGAKAR